MRKMKKIKTRIKNLILFPRSIILEQELFASSSPVILIGTPVHKNLGDHLIAENERAFLKSLFPKRDIFEIPTDIFFDREKYLVRNTPKDALIIITGGGWMGDLWPDDEYRMQKIIADYKDRKIVIFPQTIYYSSEVDKKVENDAKRVYSECDDLSMLLRERKSYDYARQAFGKLVNHIFLVPDMGLYRFHHTYEDRKIDKIGVCLREDREKEFDFDFKERIKETLQSNGYKVFNFSTMSNYDVPKWLRKFRIMNLIREINSYDCVITDRLHGMVFSVISGTKCIAYDNITHKVSGVYDEWLDKNPNLKMAESNEVSYLLDTLQSLNHVNNDNAWKKKINNGFGVIKSVLYEKPIGH